MNRPASISFAGSQLDETRHVCAFFNSEEEEYRVLLPFIAEGFERGDKAVHVVNPDDRDNHLRRLAAAGINTEISQKTGQLELRANTEAYLREGRFDQDRMLEAFEKMASSNAAGRFPVSRIVCRMDWAADQGDYLDDLIEFEARVNDVWRRHNDAVICTTTWRNLEARPSLTSCGRTQWSSSVERYRGTHSLFLQINFCWRFANAGQ